MIYKRKLRHERKEKVDENKDSQPEKDRKEQLRTFDIIENCVNNSVFEIQKYFAVKIFCCKNILHAIVISKSIIRFNNIIWFYINNSTCTQRTIDFNKI